MNRKAIKRCRTRRLAAGVGRDPGTPDRGRPLHRGPPAQSDRWRGPSRRLRGFWPSERPIIGRVLPLEVDTEGKTPADIADEILALTRLIDSNWEEGQRRSTRCTRMRLALDLVRASQSLRLNVFATVPSPGDRMMLAARHFGLDSSSPPVAGLVAGGYVNWATYTLAWNSAADLAVGAPARAGPARAQLLRSPAASGVGSVFAARLTFTAAGFWRRPLAVELFMAVGVGGALLVGSRSPGTDPSASSKRIGGPRVTC